MDLERSMDSLLSSQFTPTEPGISVLVAQKGQIVYKKAFGSANLELNTPMRPDLVFRIGSITKQFTAIAILQLAEKGLISLQDNITKYIKDFPVGEYPITIEHLLTNTSGIRDYANADTVNPFIEREDFTPARLISYFKNQPLLFKPGSKYNYSNSNWVLLGYIIQLVSGQDYHQYMKDHIIIPAGLQHTLYAEERTIVPGRVQGYTRDRGLFENTYYQSLSMGFACGDLLSNTEDLYHWNKAVLSGDLINTQNVGKAFSPYTLTDGTATHYGYGWFIDTLYGNRCIHHEGQVSGFIALEKYFPASDTYVVILTNVKSGEDKTDFSSRRFRLFNDIAYLALGNSFSKEVNVNGTVLDDYTGTYQITSGKETITIYKKHDKLYFDLSNGTGKNVLLSPLSETKFYAPDVRRIYTTFEFIKENGKVIKVIVVQDRRYEWKKVN
jgi:CubicO group peptidase (beta-lactamase class C family)